MKQLPIDDELYSFIASRADPIGEDASSILRRLLGLPKSSELAQPDARGGDQPMQTDFDALLESAAFRTRNVTDRYLAVLGEAHRLRPEHFDRLLSFGGRKRRYFGRTEQEIEASGTSCHPKRIPATQYWAMCNASNDQFGQMLSKALHLMDFPAWTVERAVKRVTE